jgi:hypothetical protein
MKGFLFWQCWLFLFGLITVIFGMDMALLNHKPLFAVSDAQVNPVLWGANPLLNRRPSPGASDRLPDLNSSRPG